MTIEEARKLLDKNENNVSDEDLQREIDTARLLADLALDLILKNKEKIV